MARIFQHIQTFSRQTGRQNRQGVPDTDFATFLFPLSLNLFYCLVAAIDGILIGHPCAFDVKIQHVQVQVINNVVVEFLQIFHILTGSRQRGVIRSANGNHHIATGFTQRFYFAVL